MSRQIVITIGREFGAEGHEIGKILAQRLGISFYDKDILDKAAKNSGFTSESLKSLDETVANRFLEPYLGYGVSKQSLNDMLFEAEERVIHEIADRESCIIVGRLADYILRNDPNCVKVFIYAPFEDRVKIIMEKHRISQEEAKKLVKKMDSARNNYYTYYSNRKWNRKEGKDILLNRSTFGVDGCVAILEAMARARM